MQRKLPLWSAVGALLFATWLILPSLMHRRSSVTDITLAKYDLLENGMSYAQVVGLLGKPGVEFSTGDLVPGYRVQMYQWFNDAQTGNMSATFQNDKLTAKAQFGLQ